VGRGAAFDGGRPEAGDVEGVLLGVTEVFVGMGGGGIVGGGGLFAGNISALDLAWFVAALWLGVFDDGFCEFDT
jgi:hypothetical protein